MMELLKEKQILFNQGYKHFILIKVKEQEKFQWILPIPSSSLFDDQSSPVVSGSPIADHIFYLYKKNILTLLNKWLHSTKVVDRAMSFVNTVYEMSIHKIIPKDAEIFISRRKSFDYIRRFNGTVLNFPLQSVLLAKCQDIVIADVVQWAKYAANLENLFFPMEYLHLTLTGGCTVFPLLQFSVYSSHDVMCKLEQRGWDVEKKSWNLSHFTIAKNIYFRRLFYEWKDKEEEEEKIFQKIAAEQEEKKERQSKTNAKNKLKKLFNKFADCKCECQCGHCHFPSCQKFYFSRYCLQRNDCTLPDMLLGSSKKEQENNYWSNRGNLSEKKFKTYARKVKHCCKRGCWKKHCKRNAFFKKQMKQKAKPLCECRKAKNKIMVFRN